MIEDEQARSRWAVIQAVRLAGAAMVVIALLILNGVVPAPEMAGYVLLVVGLADVFAIPQLLVRKWRTPPGSEKNAGIE